MEEAEPMEIIRETNRNLLFLNRRKQKDVETDVRRSLTNFRITQSDIAAIANKLKTKSSVLASDLKILQNALMDDPKNVELVLNTHGALRGLVRELTGHDVNKQCAACGCLCNLALGDSKTCCTVAKAAGAYLVAALDTFTTELALNCAWALGNLAGSGRRACDVIVAQGALPKLCDVTTRDADVRAAALYAVTHVAYTAKDDLRLDYVQKIIEALSNMDIDMDSSQLLFILSCHKDLNIGIMPEAFIQRIVEKLIVSMEYHTSICNTASNNLVSSKSTTSNCCEFIYLVRTLANFNDVKVYTFLSNYFVNNDLVGRIRMLLKTEVDESVLWFLGNMLNSSECNSIFFNQLIIGF